MNSLTLLTLSLALLASTLAQDEEVVSYQGYRVINVHVNSFDDLKFLNDLQTQARISISADGRVGKDAGVLLPPGKDGQEILRLFRRAGLVFDISEDDLGALFDAEREAIEARKVKWESLKQGDDRPVPFDIGNFHSHDEINQYIEDLAGSTAHKLQWS